MNTDTLLLIIGMKEAEIFSLKAALAQAQEKLKEKEKEKETES